MATETSTMKEHIQYGFLIAPSAYCKVINVELQEELLLSPGIQYYIPWDREETEIVRIELAATEVVHPASEVPAVDEGSLEWLRIAETSFRFWNNEIDDLWNNV